MARPAGEIEPSSRIFSSNWILPGPMRPSLSRSRRTLRAGSDLALDFCMEDLLSPITAYIATRGYCEQDEPVTYPRTREQYQGAGMNFPSLFSPLEVGPYHLKHRLVMAPLTRMRAEKPSLAPRPLNAEYYGQRATAGGLIIAEASPVVATGFGSLGVPGTYSEHQIKGWRKVVDAVHAKGGVIFLQLWHVGRVSHSSFQPGGVLPVAPSAVPISADFKTATADGKVTTYETPRALETAEISGVIDAYRQGAENALKAGFDGVEIHGANGYLIEQFLQSHTNLRTDQYGGGIENHTLSDGSHAGCDRRLGRRPRRRAGVALGCR